MIKTGTKATFAALAVILGACSMATDESAPLCPETTVLDDASAVTRFVAGAGRDIIDIDFEGKIVGLSGECIYTIDEDTGSGSVYVEMVAEFKVSRGAANKSRRADFQYFASLIDAEGRIIDKRLFPFGIEFTNNRTTMADNDAPIEMTIPLNSDQNGQDFSVLVGFQISREELDYNRAKWRK